MTELIVVIAIIAILAAVLIPSISGYITKARRGKDVELAGQMTSELSHYAAEYNVNINDLTGTDVRSILGFNGHSLVPRTNKWVFVYDRSTHKVLVKDLENGELVFSEEERESYEPLDPSHVAKYYFLVSKGESKLEKAINLMTNLRPQEAQEDENKINLDYKAAKDLLEGSDYDWLVEHFNPGETIFIDNSGAYTQATSDKSVTKIVVLEQTSCLPLIDDDLFDKIGPALLEGDVVYSNTIRMSEPESKLKNVFRGIPDIDYAKVKTIDMPAFGSSMEDEEIIYKLEMGPHFKDSHKQVIKDEILTIIKKKEDGKIIVNRKVTVSYYNKEGLFARGSVHYALLQKLDN